MPNLHLFDPKPHSETHDVPLSSRSAIQKRRQSTMAKQNNKMPKLIEEMPNKNKSKRVKQVKKGNIQHEFPVDKKEVKCNKTYQATAKYKDLLGPDPYPFLPNKSLGDNQPGELQYIVFQFPRCSLTDQPASDVDITEPELESEIDKEYGWIINDDEKHRGIFDDDEKDDDQSAELMTIPTDQTVDNQEPESEIDKEYGSMFAEFRICTACVVPDMSIIDELEKLGA